jgi:hypothetical protein
MRWRNHLSLSPACEDDVNQLGTGLLLVALTIPLPSRTLPPDEDDVEITVVEEKPAGQFANRTGANRLQALEKYGSNASVEKAVVRGLRWLALHQTEDGHWGLHDFNKHARTEPLGHGGKVVGDDSVPGTTRRNDTAGTAFGLLPFLAAGHTHKASQNTADGYHRTVDAGLKWLLAKQLKLGDDKGYFGGDAYSHALATIAVCEAYGMTGDAKLKAPAQMAVDYLLWSQHSEGGWRYAPRQAGDTSVTGFVVRALAVARDAGLKVPPRTFEKVGKFLASVETKPKSGLYGYVPGSPGRPPMTAAGALCRLLLGGDRGDAGLRGSVKAIKANPPTANGSIYYEYYATRVMFEVGGEDWKKWNEGEDGIRGVLLKRQDDSTKVKGNKGSWAGTDAEAGGRLGATSLSLLTLQVYVRYVPMHARKNDDRDSK